MQGRIVSWEGAMAAAYAYLQDEGSFWGGVVAGVFTLGGGWLAYRAGALQAAETRRAAALQAVSIKAQMAQEFGLIAERDRRATKALVAGLATEAVRLEVFLSQCTSSFHKASGGTYQGDLPAELARTYLVEPHFPTRIALAGEAGLPDHVRWAATSLYAEIDKLNALIGVRAKYGDLARMELRDALRSSLDAAKELQRVSADTMATSGISRDD